MLHRGTLASGWQFGSRSDTLWTVIVAIRRASPAVGIPIRKCVVPAGVSNQPSHSPPGATSALVAARALARPVATDLIVAPEETATPGMACNQTQHRPRGFPRLRKLTTSGIRSPSAACRSCTRMRCHSSCLQRTGTDVRGGRRPHVQRRARRASLHNPPSGPLAIFRFANIAPQPPRRPARAAVLSCSVPYGPDPFAKH